MPGAIPMHFTSLFIIFLTQFTLMEPKKTPRAPNLCQQGIVPPPSAKTPKKPVPGKPSIVPPPLFPRRPIVDELGRDSSRKVFLSAAAKEIGMEPRNFTKWIDNRNPQEEKGPDGKKRIRVDLSFNFAIRPFFVEEKIGFHSFIPETSLGTVKAYFALRKRIRKGELIPVSDGFSEKNKKYMDALREFIPLRIRFGKDPNMPFLVFERLNLSRFRVPVYEYNGSYFCKTEHADAIAFAARLWCGTPQFRAKEVPNVFAEVAKYGDASKIPYELGMKIWVLRAYSLELGGDLHRLKTDLSHSRVISEFFRYGQKDYLATSI